MPDNFHRAITLKQLRLLSVLGQELSIRRSAELLHTSQPALSRALSQLEDVVDAKLFDRTTRHMELTVAGQSLLRHANRILAELSQAQEELHDLSGGIRGEVRIGVLPAFSVFVLGEAIQQAQQLIPDVTFTIHTAETGKLYSELNDGTIDIMLSHAEFTADLSRTDIHELYQERSCIVCDPSHPLALKSSVSQRELASWPWILPPPETALRTAINRTIFVDRPPVVGGISDLQADSLPLYLGLLKSNRMLTAIPNQYAIFYEQTGTLKRLHSSIKLLKGPMCCFTLKRAEVSHASRVLINCLQNISETVKYD